MDASDVKEKGRSGRTYRLHYAIDIMKMCGLAFKITAQHPMIAAPHRHK